MKEEKLEPGVIKIALQPDGNWIGEMIKNGKRIDARANDPQIVVLMLITQP